MLVLELGLSDFSIFCSLWVNKWMTSHTVNELVCQQCLTCWLLITVVSCNLEHNILKCVICSLSSLTSVKGTKKCCVLQMILWTKQYFRCNSHDCCVVKCDVDYPHLLHLFNNCTFAWLSSTWKRKKNIFVICMVLFYV